MRLDDTLSPMPGCQGCLLRRGWRTRDQALFSPLLTGWLEAMELWRHG